MTSISNPVPHDANNAFRSWLDELFCALRNSEWEPILDAGGVDAIEALQPQIYQHLLKLSRSAKHGDADLHPLEGTESRLRWFGYFAKNWLWEHSVGRRSIPLERVTVLFWPRTRTHVTAQFPVYQELQRRGVSTQFLVCDPTPYYEAQLAGAPSASTFREWPDSIRRARRRGRIAAEKLSQTPLPQLPEMPGGVPPDVLKRTLLGYFSTMLPDVYQAVENTLRLFAYRRPQVLCVGNDLTFEGRTACFLARHFGVPTVSLMHGSVSDIARQRYHVVDRFLVYGTNAQRLLLNQGFSPDRIVVTGAPYLDHQLRQRGTVDPRLAARFNLAPNQSWILVATSGPGDSISRAHHQTLVRNLFRLAKEIPHMPILVKLHRKDRLEYYETSGETKRPSNVHVIPDGMPGIPISIFDWLHGCRLMLTGASTTAFEALLLHVPVVTMDFAEELMNIEFLQSGATQHVRSFDELLAEVKRLLNDPDAAAEAWIDSLPLLMDHFLSLDTNNSARVADVLVEMCEKGNSPALVQSNGN